MKAQNTLAHNFTTSEIVQSLSISPYHARHFMRTGKIKAINLKSSLIEYLEQ